MSWEIIVFETTGGSKPVEEFIKSLQTATITKITHGITLLEKHGNRIGSPRSKKLEGDIYELRIRGAQEVRLLYAFIGRQIYLVHAFKKQTKKTPRKEIEIAIERLKLAKHLLNN